LGPEKNNKLKRGISPHKFFVLVPVVNHDDLSRRSLKDEDGSPTPLTPTPHGLWGNGVSVNASELISPPPNATARRRVSRVFDIDLREDFLKFEMDLLVCK
jgi:hypothetical protein